MLLAQCCENDVVAPVLAFVQANFQSADWKDRDAAIMAFGNFIVVSFTYGTLNEYGFLAIHL